jgi:hypothetical protein
MKAHQKQPINKFPQVSITILEGESPIKFPEGYEPFAEKNARAKERLSKMKFPEGFFAK